MVHSLVLFPYVVVVMLTVREINITVGVPIIAVVQRLTILHAFKYDLIYRHQKWC